MATTSPDNIPYVGPSQYGEPADFPAIDEDQAQALQTLIATLRSQITAITSNSTGPAAVPVGTIVAYGSATAPTGWHLCNGSLHGSAALSTVLGSTRTPDLTGMFVVGAGTSDAGSPLVSTPSRSRYTSTNTGGTDTVTLTSAQSGIPAHTHPGSAASDNAPHDHGVNPPYTTTGYVSHNHSHSGTTGWMDRNWVHSHSASINEGITTGDSAAYIDTADNDPSVGDVYAVTVYGTDTNHQHAFGTSIESENHYHGVDIGWFASDSGNATHAHTITVSASTAANATQSHENRPPYYALTYIIKK